MREWSASSSNPLWSLGYKNRCISIPGLRLRRSCLNFVSKFALRVRKTNKLDEAKSHSVITAVILQNFSSLPHLSHRWPRQYPCCRSLVCTSIHPSIHPLNLRLFERSKSNWRCDVAFALCCQCSSIVMPLSPDSVGESTTCSCCPSTVYRAILRHVQSHCPLCTEPFVHSVLSSVCLSICPDRSCYHNISWTTWAVVMKLTRNNHYLLLMTWLDFGGQGHSRLSR